MRAVGWVRDSPGPELTLASLRAFMQQRLAHGKCLLSACCGPQRRHQRVSSNRGVEQPRLSSMGPGREGGGCVWEDGSTAWGGPQQVLCRALVFYIKISPAWYFQPGRYNSPPRGSLRPTGARGTPMVPGAGAMLNLGLEATFPCVLLQMMD